MIGKVITGKSFAGCIAYNLQRAEAIVLEASGVRTTSIKDITNDFNAQRQLNPRLGQAVGHIILSWSAEDSPKLNESIMAERAKEYMEKMKIINTQYLIVRHTDRQHPHLHLIYNRVGNEGQTISDRYQKLANLKACKEITVKYGYRIAEGKTNVNRQRLKGADQIKYNMHDAIKSAIENSSSWHQLEEVLSRQQVNIHYKYLSGTETVQGVSFSKGSTKFKGSVLDRSLSFGKINNQLMTNAKKLKTEVAFKNYVRAPHDVGFNQQSESLLEILLAKDSEAAIPTPFELIQNKRKRKKGQKL